MPPAQRRPAAAGESRAARGGGALARLAGLVRRLLGLERRGAGALPGGAAEGAAPPGRASVLLVEDDPLVSRAVARIIERFGHEVTTCADGAEALARFREDPDRFDVVLTDETLPGLRGDELAKALLELRPALPVVICTGYSDQIDEERARAMGVRALLLKPLGVSELEECLRSALRAAGK